MNNEKKKFVKKEKSSYNKLIDAAFQNLAYVERIWMKWTKKIKDAH
jgi:hypothetical protein